MNDKYTESDIRMTGKFAEKLDNFWYYHKWHTLIGLFVIFVLVAMVNAVNLNDSRRSIAVAIA